MDDRMAAMGTFQLGRLSSISASLRPDLLAGPTQAALSHAGLLDDVGVVEIDVVVIGSGVRRSKILLPGLLLARLPSVEVIDGLAAEPARLRACDSSAVQHMGVSERSSTGGSGVPTVRRPRGGGR